MGGAFNYMSLSCRALCVQSGRVCEVARGGGGGTLTREGGRKRDMEKTGAWGSKNEKSGLGCSSAS